MATEEDREKEESDTSDEHAAEDDAASEAAESPSSDEPEADAEAKPTSIVAKSAIRADDAAADVEDGPAAAPTQLGATRFVYGAYFGGAIGVAFLMSKILSFGWTKLSTLKPQVGEPTEEIVMTVSAAVGAAAALYYWKRTRARQLAEEVADELSKVTWPNKDEVTNSTIVVIVTTALSTIFFALMDRFWGFVTNLVYGS